MVDIKQTGSLRGMQTNVNTTDKQCINRPRRPDILYWFFSNNVCPRLFVLIVYTTTTGYGHTRQLQSERLHTLRVSAHDPVGIINENKIIISGWTLISISHDTSPRFVTSNYYDRYLNQNPSMLVSPK